MAKHLFNRIVIIGLGVVGSSIARAVHERNLAVTIVGCDANEIALAYARKHKFVSAVTSDPQEAVAGAELVVLATPPSTLAAIAEAIALHLDKGTIVTDVCSVKEAAIAAIMPHIPEGVDYIPAHPIAGSEKSGVEAGRGNLFEHRHVIITPDQPTQSQALQIMTRFWQALGARVEGMPPALHDMVYAYMSHLPHLLAFAAATPLTAYRDDTHVQKFLRLSGSSTTMWVEIFSLNKDNMLKALDRYLDAVAHIIHELGEAPAGSENANDDAVAHTVLFPRIAASCLITTVMEAEKLAGFPFGRYAGAGFADFINPATLPPDDDIERISGQYAGVAKVLGGYTVKLKAIRVALVEGNPEALERAITPA